MPRIQLSDSSDSDNENQGSSNNNNNKQQTQQQQQQHKKLATVRVVTDTTGTDLPVRLNNKVFIDGLPFNDPPNAEPLQEQLSQFCTAWKVGKVVHLSKKPGQGFGYLAFRSPHSVETAVTVLNGKKFLGRHLRVEVPKPPKAFREQLSANAASAATTAPAAAAANSSKPIVPAFAAASPQTLVDAQDYTKQILVSDLPPHAQPDILREVLAEYAPALERHVTKIKMTGRNRKAFITLESAEQAQELQSFLHGFTLLGRRVEASMAQPPGAAPYAPALLAVQQRRVVKHEFKDENGKDIDFGVVPAGFASSGSSTAAAANASNSNITSDSKEAKAAKKAVEREIVGTNAKKAFPMPVLINVDGAAAAATTTTAGSRIRGREEDNNNFNNSKSSVGGKPPSNSAAAAATRTAVNDRFSNSKGPRTVYVANISPDVTVQRLRAHFGGVGLVRECKLMTGPNGAPNGLASVEFALPNDARAGVAKLNGSLLAGQPIEVELDGEGTAAVHDPQGEDEATFEMRKKKKQELDDDEMDAYARHFGVKDRKKFLAEADEEDEEDFDDDHDEGVDDVAFGKNSKKQQQKQPAAAKKAGANKATKSAPVAVATKKAAKEQPKPKKQQQQQQKRKNTDNSEEYDNGSFEEVAGGAEGLKLLKDKREFEVSTREKKAFAAALSSSEPKMSRAMKAKANKRFAKRRTSGGRK